MDMTEPGASADLRRWRRYKIDLRLRVSVENGKGLVVFGRGSSLSQEGMGAYIPCEIPLGATVLLELTFPHSTGPTTIKAVVRTVDGFRYGLEFRDVARDVRAMIVKNCDGSSSQS